MSNFEITEKRIYQLLKHPFQADKPVADDLHSAYDEFIEDLFGYLNNEHDKRKVIRKLNVTYVEFATIKSLETVAPTKDNNIKVVFLEKCMSFVDREMDLVLHQMEYPKFFISVDSDWKSPFYLNPDVIKNVDIMEMACGFFYISNGIFRYDHKEIYFNDFIHAFEKLFNVEIKDIYKKEISVIKRRPAKMTEFLDRMKDAIIQKSRKEGYYTD